MSEQRAADEGERRASNRFSPIVGLANYLMPDFDAIAAKFSELPVDRTCLCVSLSLSFSLALALGLIFF